MVKTLDELITDKLGGLFCVGSADRALSDNTRGRHRPRCLVYSELCRQTNNPVVCSGYNEVVLLYNPARYAGYKPYPVSATHFVTDTITHRSTKVNTFCEIFQKSKGQKKSRKYNNSVAIIILPCALGSIVKGAGFFTGRGAPRESVFCRA